MLSILRKRNATSQRLVDPSFVFDERNAETAVLDLDSYFRFRNFVDT